MWIVPAFIGNPLDWAIYFACFVLIFKADHVYDLLHNNKAVNWVRMTAFACLSCPSSRLACTFHLMLMRTAEDECFG